MLRDGTRSDVVEFDGDDDPDTFHLGARLDGALVGVSTWLPRAGPGHLDSSTASAYQLRGMAVDPGSRGLGVGSRLLDAGLDRCRARGATLVWAHARVTALGFYLGHGFEPHGAVYVDETTGLPHRTIVRSLPGAADQVAARS